MFQDKQKIKKHSSQKLLAEDPYAVIVGRHFASQYELSMIHHVL